MSGNRFKYLSQIPQNQQALNARNHVLKCNHELFLFLETVYVFKTYFEIYLSTLISFIKLLPFLTIIQRFSAFLLVQSSFSIETLFLKILSQKTLSVNMATSSNVSAGSQQEASSEQYQIPFRTLLTPVKNLEVLSELIVDFNSLKENVFDLTEEIRAQGWRNALTKIYQFQHYRLFLKSQQKGTLSQRP